MRDKGSFTVCSSSMLQTEYFKSARSVEYITCVYFDIVVKLRLEFPAFQDCFEIQKNSIKSGQKVVIIDDLLATGGKKIMSYSIYLIG